METGSKHIIIDRTFLARKELEEPMNQKIRILIVDDHAIMRECLRSLLSNEKNFEILGEAEDGRAAVNLSERIKPDLILTDLSMPKMNGMDMIEAVKRRLPETKIIALTVQMREEYVLATLKAGADGYILKHAGFDELKMAIKSVLNGNHYISPEISGTVIEGYLEGKKSLKIPSAWEALTKREREILKLIGEGHRNKEIADQLYISINTVEKHRSNLMDKLKIHNSAGLIAFAVENGLAQSDF